MKPEDHYNVIKQALDLLFTESKVVNTDNAEVILNSLKYIKSLIEENNNK